MSALILVSLLLSPQSLPASNAQVSTTSLSNVKQISIATLMYAADHKGSLPSSKGFKAAVMPYLRNESIFTAPGAPKGTVSYLLNPRLSGKKTTQISRPSETAMIIEGKRGKAVFPYRGLTALGYADGHARLVDLGGLGKALKAALG